jgi:hypothetical protein
MMVGAGHEFESRSGLFVVSAISKLLSVGVAAIAGLALAPAPAHAARPLTLGMFDPRYAVPDDPDAVRFLFDSTAASGARIAKIGVGWRGVASNAPADPADPADPAYDFGYVDRAVRDAASRGLEPMLMVSSAPDFAEGPGRPADAAPGSWKPSPSAFADFGQALARRYSGVFETAAGVLPRVRYFQAWNEPNLPNHLAPQYEDETPVSASAYRELLNAFYDSVKAISADNVVVTAGTAPYGDEPPSGRTRPLWFWRQLLCLDEASRATACPVKARFDVLAHNPISPNASPARPPSSPDDLTAANFGSLRELLRAAEAQGTLATAGPHPLWATELWWETRPPDSLQGVRPRVQARRIARAFSLLWHQGASAAIYFTVRDGAYVSSDYLDTSSSGLFYVGGAAKPGATAFRFPFVATRAGKRSLAGWGRAPVGGRLLIKMRRRGRWQTVKKRSVDPGEVFEVRLPADVGLRLRAQVGGERSLVWRRGRDRRR